MIHNESKIFSFLKKIVKLFYKKIEIVGMENLPKEASVIVGNHSQAHGPLACELYFPYEPMIWCAGQMMHLKDVPPYTYKDFWSYKPGWTQWFYKILSYLIAPLSVYIFNRAHTIGVYRDARIMGTFKTTIKVLQGGKHVVIFPEKDEIYNHILFEFQVNFVNVAKLYYKKTGKALAFVPLYIAPKLKKMYLGQPIYYCPENDIEVEKERICNYLKDEITKIACELPEHIVIPYRNMPKKDYVTNISCEVTKDEKTCC